MAKIKAKENDVIGFLNMHGEIVISETKGHWKLINPVTLRPSQDAKQVLMSFYCIFNKEIQFNRDMIVYSFEVDPLLKFQYKQYVKENNKEITEVKNDNNTGVIVEGNVSTSGDVNISVNNNTGE